MTSTGYVRFVTFLLIALVVTASVSVAQDWPQWRGPGRDGIVNSFIAPSVWPEKLKTVWKVQAGIGHSSPVVAGNRAYLLSRQQESEGATCLDINTGNVLWRERYPIAYQMNPAAVTHGKGPKSTPVI